MATTKRRGRRADPSSKSGSIRKLLSSGMTAAQIAKKVGCTVALVYNVKSKAQGPSRGKTTGKKRGRKPGSTAAVPGDLGAILAAVKNSEKERTQMRAALEKIAAIINDALD